MTFSTFFSLSLLLASSVSPLPSPAVSPAPTSGITLPVTIQYQKSESQNEHFQRPGIRRDIASVDVEAFNTNVIYVVEVTIRPSNAIGSTGETYQLAVDTGSANTWYQPRQASRLSIDSSNKPDQIFVAYKSGNFSGYIQKSSIDIGLATVPEQLIGVAMNSSGLAGFDGILGIGPKELTKGTTSSGNILPTVTDNLKTFGVIETAVVSIYFEPTVPDTNGPNGEITFGTTDAAKYIGDVSYVPVSKTPPASFYWGIDLTITYGADAISNPILSLLPSGSSPVGIVDTGTTLIYFATEAFRAYANATGATLDKETGFLMLPADKEDTLKSLFFNIGDYVYELTPNAQLWPRHLNPRVGGSPRTDVIFLVISNLETGVGQGMDFILGLPFLQRYYSVFDTSGARLGFAPTDHTYDKSN